MDPFAYMPRFAAARLVVWWSKRPDQQKWQLERALAIGDTRRVLLGGPPLRSKKLADQVQAKRLELVAEMLGPELECEAA